MTQEELIREVGKVIPNGMYSEEVIQLAFTMFTHGYNYAVDKACELIEKLCDGHNIVSIKDGKYKSRSWLEEQFRKGMEE